MTRIGIFSDTHDYLDPAIAEHFKHCQEIWHAGDFGSIKLVEALEAQLTNKGLKIPIRGVYGNIDGNDIRSRFPLQSVFQVEGVKVMMQHIGGYPGRYAPGVKTFIAQNDIRLFISGHSHILKVMYDNQLNCLHINPGAAGKQGWHKVKTLVRLTIDGSDMKDCEVVELS